MWKITLNILLFQQCCNMSKNINTIINTMSITNHNLTNHKKSEEVYLREREREKDL